MYPTLVCFNKGKVTATCVGEIYKDTYLKIHDLAFVNIMDTSKLVNQKGDNILSLSRSIDDVQNDLSIENQNKIKEFNNDQYSETLTYELLEKSVVFSKVNKVNSKLYYNDVSDFISL